MNWKTPAKASPQTIRVPRDSPTIQGAINRADSGDTILVSNGTYNEDIIINKSVSVIGVGRDLAIICGNVALYVVSITVGGVTFEGFTVKKNVLNQYGSGMLIVSIGNTVRNNKIVNSSDGLAIHSPGRNVVSDNVLSDNVEGVGLYFSSNNVFSGNTILDNVEGVGLYFSSNNVFSGNTILNNSEGVGLYSSSGDNLFYHNNFNSTAQVVLADSTNVWSHYGEGNYWADYTVQDSNGDGIGEEPYLIDADNQDNYPLMGMFHGFEITSENETYYPTIISNSTVSGFGFEIGKETGNKILSFNVTGEDGTVGFCRIMIPTGLMSYPYIALSSRGEILPNLLDASNETNAILYFTYAHSSQTITLISSKTLHLYDELLSKYLGLQADLHNLNITYYMLLNNYTTLLGEYNQFRQDYAALNFSYYEHLLDFSASVQDIQNLMYIFAATTAIFLITTAYLSKRAHAHTVRANARVFEKEK